MFPFATIFKSDANHIRDGWVYILRNQLYNSLQQYPLSLICTRFLPFTVHDGVELSDDWTEFTQKTYAVAWSRKKCEREPSEIFCLINESILSPLRWKRARFPPKMECAMRTQVACDESILVNFYKIDT